METAGEYPGDLKQFLKDYNYQPTLTPILDGLGGADLTQELVAQIVLWKVNRYVSLDAALLDELNQLKILQPGQHGKAKAVLVALLGTQGVDLPMASALLRFRNPGVFQIIDRHAYRALYGEAYPLYTATPVLHKVGVYWQYLDDLWSLCMCHGLDFWTVDRLLYTFDKARNGPL